MSRTTIGSDLPARALQNPVGDHGELSTPEFVFRAGLLVGAGYFFNTAFGLPWNRNMAGIAAMLVSALIVSTMTFQWRVLGDWRRHTQQGLYALLFIALTFPIAAALSPKLGTSVLPDFLEGPIVQILATVHKIPGVSFLADALMVLLSFLFFVLTLFVLLIGGKGTKRGGVLLIFAINTLICLFFYPVLETILGFVFLCVFFHAQWETPLLISDRVRAALRPVQLDYLRLLAKSGSLSTGETRVLLENESRYFAELLDFHLVEYSAADREVTPGSRLAADSSAAATAEKTLGYARRILWFVIGIVYFLMPDFLPGPIDDLVVLALCLLSGFNFAKLFGPNN